MNNKLKSLIVLLAIIILPIGIVIADQFNASPQDYNSTHTGDGCHDPGYPGSVDPTGSIELTSSIGTTIGPGATFTVDAKIIGFDDGGAKTVALVFLTYNDDNDQFTFNPSYKWDISVDASGDSAIESFTVTAPSKAVIVIV